MLADANEINGFDGAFSAHLFGQSADHASPGAAIQFGQNDSGHAHRGIEAGQLTKRILAYTGIQHQKRFMRRRRIQALNDPATLRNSCIRSSLACKRPAVSQSTTSQVARPGGLDGVIDHRCAVRTLLLRHHTHIVACAPGSELLHRCRPKGVAPRPEAPADLAVAAVFANLPREVVLPAPLTPTANTTQGRCAPTRKGCSSGCTSLLQKFRQGVAERGLVVQFLPPHLAGEGVNDASAGGGAHIGGQQGSFEVLERCLIQSAFTEQQIAKTGREPPAGSAQPQAQPPPGAGSAFLIDIFLGH